MHTQPLHVFKSSYVRIAVAALLILAALPGRVTAQQNNMPAASAVPQIIQFSGTLGSTSAPAPSGTVSITFTLYENEQGGTALWSETQNVQVDAQGHYTALLGSISPEGLPLNMFTTVQAHWLAVQPLLQGFGEQPRVLLVSAPYALKAEDAETIGGLPPSAFVRADASSGTSVVTTTASTGSAPSPNTVSGSGTTPAPPIPPLQQYYNAGLGYKIGGKIVLALPGGLSDFNIALGYQALVHNTTGYNNTASGVQALESNTTGGNNTASGVQALYNNTYGSYNTASGQQALYSNTHGSFNTASGWEALFHNSSGNGNTASGATALYSNTTGTDNTASGFNALLSNTIGSNNTASGFYALYSNTAGYDNTASGVIALQNNTTGRWNTASGNGALFNNTTGASNTADGFEALVSNTTASNNIAIGFEAAMNVSGGNNNNIHIGSFGSSGDSDAIRIGTSGTQTTFYVAGVSGVTTGLNNAAPVLIDSNGQLGTISSSRRFKEDIHDMGDASEGLMRLRPVTFRYKKPFDDGSKPIQYGLIAEEVAEVYPDLVARSADGQIETVKYQVLDPMLLNEVQRQQKEMQAQQTEIRNQKALVLAEQSQLKAQQTLAGKQQEQIKAQQALLKTQQAQIAELVSNVKTIQASLHTRRGSGPALPGSPLRKARQRQPQLTPPCRLLRPRAAATRITRGTLRESVAMATAGNSPS
jgi:hypothetical protein